jgi:hypothetical protein
MPQLPQRAASAQTTLPALTRRCDDIARYFTLFNGLVEQYPQIPGLPLALRWKETEWQRPQLRAARRVLAQWPQMQRDWGVVSRPARANEISGAVVVLLGKAFPNMERADLRQFGRLLRDEVCADQPSLYVLIRACREVRRNYEFLSIRCVVRMMAQEARKARQLDYLLTKFPLPALVARAEDDDRRRAEQMAEREDAFAEEHAEYLQWLAERWPPDLCPAAFDDAELEMLRLQRGQLLAWRKQFLAEHPDLRRELSEFERQAVNWRALQEQP